MKTLLVVSGLDPSGGAGFLADARVAAEHGVRVVGVVTAATVQDSRGVRASSPLPAEVIDEQLRALLGDAEVHAVKIGMLGDAQVAVVVAEALAATRAPVVWDPVLAPSRGGVALLAGEPAVAARALFPEVRLITPNLFEAAWLSGQPEATDVDGMRRAGEALVTLGAGAALVKGGHLAGARSPDVLVEPGGVVTVLDGERLDAGPLHGTGCVLSTAIACALADGAPLADAVTIGRAYLRSKIAAPLTTGRGARTLV